MFIRKSKIDMIIQKEKRKEFLRSSAEFEKLHKKTVAELAQKQESEIKDITKYYEKELKRKQQEILQLRQEISKNHDLYQKIRQRELELDNLSASFDTVLNEMNIKVQESIQPFYRMRAKIETTKRISDKRDNKVQSIFQAM
ncbi:MAG: hypothetical protein JXK07_04845 [Spirochaetes bacterium]|nr:hypothetical protein [Spirochaetota bacterium]MBN2769574.1 hypothetical protein [Spirochaetota bacterium]HRX15579.1 hypothetical protein [Spirochaetota bacterium]